MTMISFVVVMGMVSSLMHSSLSLTNAAWSSWEELGQGRIERLHQPSRKKFLIDMRGILRP